MSGGTTVVVGAAQGIGAEIAERLSREDWVSRLVLADIKAEACAEVAAAIERDGLTVESHPVDVTDPGSVADLVAASAGVDRVAIASGAFAPDASLEVERETFARIIDVNLEGSFFCAQGFAAEMAADGGGAIVGVASIAAPDAADATGGVLRVQGRHAAGPAGPRHGGRRRTACGSTPSPRAPRTRR